MENYRRYFSPFNFDLTKPADVVSVFTTVMLLTKKTIAKMGSEMNQVSAAKPSAFALKQMEKMGWKEGQGLGKDETGIVKHIAVKKREENLGLGGDAPEVSALPEHWWHDAFSANLNAMKSKMKDKKSKKDKKDKKDKKGKKDKKDKPVIDAPPTYEELFKATGGARLGMRARADQKGKLKRTEDTGIAVNDKNGVAEKVEVVKEKKKRRLSE